MVAASTTKAVDGFDPDLNRVPDRVKAFRDKCPIQDGWGIETDLLRYEHCPGDTSLTWCVVKVTIRDPESRVVGQGHARVRVGDGKFSEKSLIETCETKALGRALAACGLLAKEYATDFEIATVSGGPVDTNAAPAARKPAEKSPAAKKKTTKVAKKEVAKAPESPQHTDVVDAAKLLADVAAADTPEQLTDAFNTARLHAGEFDDWTEVSATATEQFKAINQAFMARGEEVPGNDGAWATFITAMKADKAAMRAARRMYAMRHAPSKAGLYEV